MYSLELPRRCFCPLVYLGRGTARRARPLPLFLPLLLSSPLPLVVIPSETDLWSTRDLLSPLSLLPFSLRVMTYAPTMARTCFVYLLSSRTRNLYTGVKSNLMQRNCPRKRNQGLASRKEDRPHRTRQSDMGRFGREMVRKANGTCRSPETASGTQKARLVVTAPRDSLGMTPLRKRQRQMKRI